MKFHVNAKGEPGLCKAERGGCPFGGESEHFTSKEAARTNYEAQNEVVTFPMSLKEMNEAAKSTDDPELIEKIIEQGSKRTLLNLSKNPNHTYMQGLEVLEKNRDSIVRLAFIKANPQLNVYMTPDDLVELLAKVKHESDLPLNRSSNELTRLVNNPGLTDEHYEEVIESGLVSIRVKQAFEYVLNEKNEISPDKTREYLEMRKWRSERLAPLQIDPIKALSNRKLKENDLIDAPDEYLKDVSWSALNYKPIEAEQFDVLTRVAILREVSQLRQTLVRNQELPDSSLAMLASANVEPESVYTHPNASKATQRIVASTNENKPFVKIAKLKAKVGADELKKLIKSEERVKLEPHYSRATVKLDLEKIKAYGLNKEDIDYFLGGSVFNAKSTFDEATGVFEGLVPNNN